MSARRHEPVLRAEGELAPGVGRQGEWRWTLPLTRNSLSLLLVLDGRARRHQVGLGCLQALADQLTELRQQREIGARYAAQSPGVPAAE